MKKKGDLARQLLQAKDDEVAQVAAKLRAAQQELQELRDRDRDRSREAAERAAVTASRDRENQNQLQHTEGPASPAPGFVTRAALEVLTPATNQNRLASASLESIELGTPLPGAGPGTAAGAAQASHAMQTRPLSEMGRGAGVGAAAGMAIKQMQSQVSLLISENQALKSRLQAEQSSRDTGRPGDKTELLSNLEREQYLRQAFYGLFKAKQGLEMQNLARVMCAILGLSEAQQGEVMERCEVLGTVNLAQSAFETIGKDIQDNLSSLFA